ncbi:hypothetical protein GH714_014586 [Hevea brasiliensis]|uniref:Bulb-type lectin domain-containing protein n=1 Tax=Hevea brasiliensis TaxID=3981 RepID=A0A6A6KRB5_HEVBR|nr:hypothetical protein GH714_014586 [Hevea brasiliensis]
MTLALATHGFHLLRTSLLVSKSSIIPTSSCLPSGFKIPDKTIVWSARDEPAQQGSKVQINADGLKLTDPRGQLIWNSPINSLTESVSYGAVLDTGNFVLVGTNSDYLWESFKNPTDTILPSQTLESGTILVSSLSETNFSRGRFELYFSDGALHLSPLAWPTKLKYGPYFTSDNGSQLVFNESAHINLIQTNGKIVQLRGISQDVPPSVATHYYRATIDYYGVFTKYAYPKDSNGEESWSIVRYIPENVCSAIDNDLGRGAWDNLEGLYDMRELPNVNWPLGIMKSCSPIVKMSAELLVCEIVCAVLP